MKKLLIFPIIALTVAVVILMSFCSILYFITGKDYVNPLYEWINGIYNKWSSDTNTTVK